jgi:hypothetical protein
MLFADPEQYPDSEKGNEPFLLPSQLGILQNMHGNPATEGTSKLLQRVEFLGRGLLAAVQVQCTILYWITCTNYLVCE